MRIAVVTETWPPEVNGAARGDEEAFVRQAAELTDNAQLRSRIRGTAHAPVETLDPATVLTSFANLLTGFTMRRAP